MFEKINFLVTLIKFFGLVHAYHYRGGTIAARSSNSTQLEVKVSFGWRLGGIYCDYDTIRNRELIGPSNEYIYSEDKKVTTVFTYCESFSIDNDWSYGIKKFVVTAFTSQISFLYEGCCWISPLGQHSNWQIKMSIYSLVNKSPFAVMFPIGNSRSTFENNTNI
jgi:hypothetical protein